MKSKRFLLTALSFCLCICSVLCIGLFGVNPSAEESVYTLSEDEFDEESGELSYRKITYSTNTYKTTNVTTSDAVGDSVDVSDDAQYVFFPYEYEKAITDDTCVSFKFKNDGVKRIAMHVEYGAGISAGGVDYDGGFKYVCVNALDSSTWNVSFSKSIDGYDVFTVLFGNYAGLINDVSIRGFRLYFDYAEQVSQTRSFEVFGYTVHEEGVVPSFASDPKGCRLTKLTSNDVEIVNDSCVVEGTATLSAKILDFSDEYQKLNFEFTLNQGAIVSVLLDGETVSNGEYGVGSHKIVCDFTKDEYSTLDITVESDGCTLTVDDLVLVAEPYADTFTGSSFTISVDGEQTTVSYTYKTGWYLISAPIRKYTKDYDCLLIEMSIDTPIVIGILIDDEYLYSHWSNTEPLEVGEHSFFFSLTGLSINDSSSLVIYLDPAITGYTGVDGTKTVTFTNIEFKNSQQMQKATISVDEEFVFDYDGKPHGASGATTNSGETLSYEYKSVFSPDSAYDGEMPVDAGEYDVRVVSPLNMTYATTYAYSKIIINKIEPSTPTIDSLQIDYGKSLLYYDSSVYSVSNDQTFENVIASGSGVLFGDTLFVKYVESQNYYESDPVSFTLDKREGEVSISINFAKETTVETIEEDVEYSKDGLNWTVGSGKKIMLEVGNIYLFRKKATSNSFAGKITYLAVPYRPEAPSAPELESTTDKTITVKQVEGAEYRLSDTVWQSSPVFEGLSKGMEVTVYIRIKGGNGSYASEAVGATFVVGGESKTESVNNNPTTKDEKGCKNSLSTDCLGLSLTLVLGVITVNLKRRKV